MTKTRRFVLFGLFVVVDIVLLVAGGFAWMTRGEALKLVYNPVETRSRADETPADFGLAYEEIALTTADGVGLAGWYIPTQNGAVVLAQHGFRSNRGEMLEEAAILAEAGYGVALIDLRAHGDSDGELVTFGVREMADLEALYQFVIEQPGVDPRRIGVLGNSYGGSTVILYAAQNPNIAVIVADSPFYSLEGTVATSVEYFTGLPAFPFAPAIRWWAEQETGINAGAVAAINVIDEISPRPIYLMMGGEDVIVAPESGQLLYEAAGEPKTLWYEPAIGHVEFQSTYPDEYAARLLDFYNTYLLSDSLAQTTP